jgi:hypothetical protein
MRKMLLALCLFASFNVFSSERNPLDCPGMESKITLSYFNLEKVFENGSQVIYTFNALWGSCSQDSHIIPNDILIRKNTLLATYDGLTNPFRSNAVGTFIEHVGSNSEVKITLTLNKLRLLKSYSSRNIKLRFNPTSQLNKGFNILLKLSRTSESEATAELKFQNK